MQTELHRFHSALCVPAPRRTPLLVQAGFTDDLFPIGKSVRLYDLLRAGDPRAPGALQLGDLGHNRAANHSKTNQVRGKGTTYCSTYPVNGPARCASRSRRRGRICRRSTTRAEPQGDGRIASPARKIFITWGDHDMTANIVHLVLARIPDAPQGTKGVSLFLVPKYSLRRDGTPGERNDVFCGLGRAQARHPREPDLRHDVRRAGRRRRVSHRSQNEGLAAMFTMMNYMRLGVGAQGVGLADRAYQAAARTRVTACKDAHRASEDACRSSVTRTCGGRCC